MAKTALTNRTVYELINCFAPFETCESWDNSGLLSGCMDNEVTGIYCALDVSMRVIEDALDKSCNLIVTHHPIMFGGRKNLREDDTEGKMLCRLVRENISVISAHTNFDKADGGVNDVLAKALGVVNVRKVDGDEEGYLRIGDTVPIRLKDFVEKTKLALGDAVRAYGDREQVIKTVALCGGAGGEFAALAKAAGADAYVTGEMRYHDSLDLAQSGFATLQAGHDATEKLAVYELKRRIEEMVKQNNYGVNVYLSKIDLFSLMLGR